MEILELSWVEQASSYLLECSYPGYTFEIRTSRTGSAYLRAFYDEPDAGTGEMERQYTRRWFLSPEMTKSEVVSTAFKCILTSSEHRVREWFRYRDRAIYHPHYDVDALHAVADQFDHREP